MEFLIYERSPKAIWWEFPLKKVGCLLSVVAVKCNEQNIAQRFGVPKRIHIKLPLSDRSTSGVPDSANQSNTSGIPWAIALSDCRDVLPFRLRRNYSRRSPTSSPAA